MKNVSVNCLILEVTRKCNLECKHCLRGNMQNIDMEKNVVDNLLKNISQIGQIFFSGGEPALNIPLINYVFQQIRKKKISLGGFGVITNGRANQKKLAISLMDNYDLAQEPDHCYAAISLDQYHTEGFNTVTMPVQPYLKALKFYSDDHEHPISFLYAEGRAASFASACTHYICEIESDKEGDQVWADELYINALGDVLGDCNLSYESQPQYAIGNVLERSFYDILDQYIQGFKGEKS